MTEISETSPVHGGCLCGAVHVTVTQPPAVAANCHCLDCRKFFAAGHNSIAIFPEDGVAIEGAVSGYTMEAESGHPITRHFCPSCGSPIYATGPGYAGMVMLPIAVLDGDPDPGIRPQVSVFTRSAAPWDPPLAGIPAFAGAPPKRG
jgi:hypothetical protein